MARSKFYSDFRNQIDKRIVRPGQVRVHGLHYAVGIVWAGDRQHGGMRVFYDVAFGPQAAGDDDLAVLGERFADRVQRFLDRGVDEAASVDDDEVGAGVVGRGEVALGPQLGEDALRVYKCLGTAEGNEPDFRAFYRNRLAEGIPETGTR